MKKITYLIVFVLFLSNLSAQDFSHWKKNNPQNQAPIKHQVWDSFLKKYIKPDSSNLNLFQYSAVKKEAKNN